MISMAVAVSIIIAISVARYGTVGLQRLAHHPIYHPWLIGIAVLLQVELVAGLRPALVLTVASAACIAGFAWANRRSYGVVLAAIGATLNFLVMAAADGRMPVNASVVAYLGGAGAPTGSLLAGTKSMIGVPHWGGLAILSDWILLPGAMGVAAWSIGDMILLTGLALVFWTGMKRGQHAEAT